MFKKCWDRLISSQNPTSSESGTKGFTGAAQGRASLSPLVLERTADPPLRLGAREKSSIVCTMKKELKIFATTIYQVQGLLEHTASKFQTSPFSLLQDDQSLLPPLRFTRNFFSLQTRLLFSGPVSLDGSRQLLYEQVYQVDDMLPH